MWIENSSRVSLNPPVDQLPHIQLSDLHHLKLAIVIKVRTMATGTGHTRNPRSVMCSRNSDIRHHVCLDCQNCQSREGRQRTVASLSSAFHDVKLAVLIKDRIFANNTEHTRCMGQKYVRSGHHGMLQVGAERAHQRRIDNEARLKDPSFVDW